INRNEMVLLKYTKGIVQKEIVYASNKFMIGVDIGTTSTKAVLYQETGEIISTNHQSYKLYSPDIHTAELDLREILQAVVLVIKNVMETSQVDPNDISFIYFSSSMHSVIAFDKLGESITYCISWS